MGDQSGISEMNERLKKRRDLIVDGLIDIGIAVKRPKATYYIWAKVPEGYTSSDFCERLIEETGVVVTPGIGFGDYGEGYFRISITTKEERIREAIKRLKGICAKRRHFLPLILPALLMPFSSNYNTWYTERRLGI